MLDGMFVFFICSLSPPPSPSSAPFSVRLDVSSPAPCLYPSAPSRPATQCSVSCGGGVQARSIQCLRQGRPAGGCLPHQRPVTSRACNTHFCPAAPPATGQRPGRVTAAGPTPDGKGEDEFHPVSLHNLENRVWELFPCFLNRGFIPMKGSSCRCRT